MTTDLTINQGKTFSQVLRVASLPYIYKAITAITQAAPALITSTGHGLTPNQRVAVVSANGMTQINAVNSPLRASDYHKVTVVDPNTISINDINSMSFSAYTSGGYLQFLTPISLAGASARMTVKDTIAIPNYLICTTAGTTGTVMPSGSGPDGIAVWSVPTGAVSRTVTWGPGLTVALNTVIDLHELLRLDTTLTSPQPRIVLDDTNHTITLTVSAVDTAAITWTSGVYDLELVSAAGVVNLLLSGNITIVPEVTT